MELSLDGTKFVKTETGWVDKKSKEPASLDYQTLLSKIEKSSAVAVPGAPSQSSNNTLPKSSSGTSKASDDIKALDKKLVLLTKSIEKLIKTLDKQPNHQNQPAIPVEATPASVPITKETAKEVAAMKAKDPTLTSKKALEQLRERQSAQLGQPADKKPSLLKETGKEYAKSASNIVRGTVEAAFPILKPLFRANDNIKAKKQEAAEKLEKKPQGSGFKSVADAINPISSKFSAKKFTEDSEKSIQTVNISDSSIEKIAQAIKPGKEKEKDSKGLAGLFSKLENVFKSAFSVISNVIKSIVGLIATPFKAVGKLFGLGGGAKATAASKIGAEAVGNAAAQVGSKSLFGRAGGLLKGGTRLLKGGAIAAAGGIAADTIASKAFGVGKNIDKAALDAQDTENWNQANLLEKTQTIAPKIIEGTGRLFLMNKMADQAQANRVKKDTAYLDKKGKTKKNSKSEAADQRDLNAEEDTRTDAMANRPPGTYVAGELVKPGQSMSAKQRAATEMDMSMGNTPSAEIMNSYEMPAAPVKPIGMTPQSKALASANYNNAKAKDERTKSATSSSVNNYAPTNITNVSSSQGGGSSDRTVGPRGALDLPVHASPYSSMVA